MPPNVEAPKADVRLKPCPLQTRLPGVKHWVFMYRRSLDTESIGAYSKATEITQATCRCGMRGPHGGDDGEDGAVAGWNLIPRDDDGAARSE